MSLSYQQMQKLLQCTVALVNQTALRALYFFKLTGTKHAGTAVVSCFNSYLLLFPRPAMINKALAATIESSAPL